MHHILFPHAHIRNHPGTGAETAVSGLHKQQVSKDGPTYLQLRIDPRQVLLVTRPQACQLPLQLLLVVLKLHTHARTHTQTNT
jgi:hypothetical protein